MQAVGMTEPENADTPHGHLYTTFHGLRLTLHPSRFFLLAQASDGLPVLFEQ
jgi:hypothetical protein